MYCQLIKVVCKPGEDAATRQGLDRYVKAASLNPGFVHGSWFVPEALPGGETPGGFSIKDREHTYFVYLAFRSPRDMLKHVELYHGEDINMLPSPHDYLLGAFNESTSIEVQNLYEE
ncbi:MAG: hypothetical protein KF696_03340 [Planctomycetes bacterium]|nr:hypothetical protein [Planctomycetota bacterium]MCW8135040.1 hypothetical protein [Planctomycetota bacterium]